MGLTNIVINSVFFVCINALSDPLFDYKSSSIGVILKNEGTTGNTFDIDLSQYPTTVTIENTSDIGLCNDICFTIDDPRCLQVNYDIGRITHTSITVELYAYQTTIAPGSDDGGVALCQYSRCIFMHDNLHAPLNSTSGFGMHLGTGGDYQGHESLNDGEWAHIIAIWDGVADTETLYVNDDPPITVQTSDHGGGTNHFCLNTHPTEQLRFVWHGCYRRVRIFDGSLNNDDIATLKQEYKTIQRASCKPLIQNCETLGGIKHVNWNDLMNGAQTKPNLEYNISVSSEDLTLSIDVILDYLGYAHGGMDNVYGYGITYHLGFYLFDSLNNNIYEPSNCDNRLSESFMNQTWYDHWVYSEYPYLQNQIGTNEFLAYPPPSQYWKLSTLDGSCSEIKYSATFEWNDLRDCQSFDGLQQLIDINIDNDTINMDGIFYVNVVSPISKDIDIHKYYVYELLSHPFTISVPKSIYILDSIGISLFRATVISVGKKDNEDIFNMIVLTESGQHISLTNPILLSTPNGNNFVSLNNVSDCVSVNSYICTQFWSFESNNISCPYILSGEYGLQFTAICNSDSCDEYINIHGPIVSLTYDLNFEDSVCNNQLHLFEFSILNTFYDDNLYNEIIATSHLYKIGEDRVYVEIEINNVNSGPDIINIILTNVWLCTIDPLIDLQIDENNIINTGCFSPNIDINGLYLIIFNYDEAFNENAQHEPVVNTSSNNTIIRYSFIVPNNVRRDTLYIQSQINIMFTDGNIRRRFLLNTNHKNQISHSISNVGVYNDNINNNNNVPTATDDYNFIVIIIVLICVMILLLAICMCIKKKKNVQNELPQEIQQHEEINVPQQQVSKSNIEISGDEILKHINSENESINTGEYVE